MKIRYLFYQKVLFILLVLIAGNIVVSCYRHRMIAHKEILSIENRDRIILHRNKRPYEIKNATIFDNQLHGFIYPVSKMPRARRVVDIYVNKPGVINKFEDSNKISIHLNDIEAAKVHDLKVGATIITAAATTAALVLIINAATDDDDGPKNNSGSGSNNSGSNSGGSSGGSSGGTGTGTGTMTSCPFTYVNNGNSLEFVGEIYSGSIYPELERNDYLTLSNISNIDGQYILKISNELREVQHTNLLELLVFDHPRNTKVLVDKDGESHLISNPQSPLDAIDKNGESMIDVVKSVDDMHYLSDLVEDTCLMDAVYLTFDKPENTDHAKLIIQGKNSIWLDYIYGEMIEFFGRKYDKWSKKIRIKDEAYMRQWALDQGLPLSVYLKSDGKWKFVDYYHTMGPLAEKQDVLRLDLLPVNSNLVEIKLESGFLFWELDYIAMDFTPEIPMSKIIVQVEQAVDHHGKDVSTLIRMDDNLYLDQPEIDDEVDIAFHAPLKYENMERTVILHSKGHYEIKSNSTEKPDIVSLTKFEEPGALSRFSKEKFLEVYKSATE